MDLGGRPEPNFSLGLHARASPRSTIVDDSISLQTDPTLHDATRFTSHLHLFDHQSESLRSSPLTSGSSSWRISGRSSGDPSSSNTSLSLVPSTSTRETPSTISNPLAPPSPLTLPASPPLLAAPSSTSASTSPTTAPYSLHPNGRLPGQHHHFHHRRHPELGRTTVITPPLLLRLRSPRSSLWSHPIAPLQCHQERGLITREHGRRGSPGAGRPALSHRRCLSRCRTSPTTDQHLPTAAGPPSSPPSILL